MIEKIWIGRYGYSFEEGKEEYHSFEITANYSNGSFEGTVYEEEFSGKTNDLVHVKGFIEDDLISFVKTYPYLYEIDEKGNIFVDKGYRGHSVIYQGNFNKSKGEWSGDWEIIISEERDKSQKSKYKTLSFLGPWDMKLK